MTTNPVINIADLPLKAASRGTKIAAEAGRVGGAIGLKMLGAQYLVVQPGKSAFPFHAHRANEEFYLVLEGTGRYRLGAKSYDVRAGDFMAAPAGGPETAHQLTNTGHGPLRYVVMSTRNDPDVVEYPDSGKFMVAAGVPDGAGMLSASFSFIGRRESAVDYYDGEETEAVS